MFSSTFSTGRRLQNWYTRPICRLRKMASRSSFRAWISVFPINTFPSVGRSTPPMMCSRVDFPEPEGPTMETNSPFSTLKDTLSRALTWAFPLPYVFERFSHLKISIYIPLSRPGRAGTKPKAAPAGRFASAVQPCQTAVIRSGLSRSKQPCFFL